MSSTPKYVVHIEGNRECEFEFNPGNQEHYFDSIEEAEEIIEENDEDRDMEGATFIIYEIHLTKIKEVIYT